MRNHAANPGFTSLELSVAVLAAGILILVAGTMVVQGYRAWHDHVLTVTLRRDATLSLDMASRKIRAASRDEVSATGDTLSIIGTNTTSTFTRNGKALVYDPDTDTTGGEMVLIRNFVTSFTPELKARGVELTIRLAANDENMEFHGTTAWRN